MQAEKTGYHFTELPCHHPSHVMRKKQNAINNKKLSKLVRYEVPVTYGDK